MEQFTALLTGLIFSVGTFFGWYHPLKLSELPVIPPAPKEASTSEIVVTLPVASSTVGKSSLQASSSQATIAPKSTGLSEADLLALASAAFPDGSVPLGDNKYVTDAPKKGYVYLCNVHKDNPGSMVNGPWMHGTSWNYLQKVSVDGKVTWPNAKFSITTATHGVTVRILDGNGLPVGFTTGIFPVVSTDDAYQYDRNPNTIKTQTLHQQFPINPVFSETPYCMGGEVGVMTDGVALFNAFDAGLRDAAAHELQDSCDGHPQGSGEYHYHNLSSCFKDIGISTVLGYALDGFPITGSEVAKGKYLTTDDLDVCHGITSDVKIDGKTVTTYHYVMTRDFPYSASCFRGKPVSLFVIAGAGQQGQTGQPSVQQSAPPQGSQSGGPPAGGPPQVAISACEGIEPNGSCSFTDEHGAHSGRCYMMPDKSDEVCVPQ